MEFARSSKSSVGKYICSSRNWTHSTSPCIGPVCMCSLPNPMEQIHAECLFLHVYLLARSEWLCSKYSLLSVYPPQCSSFSLLSHSTQIGLLLNFIGGTKDMTNLVLEHLDLKNSGAHYNCCLIIGFFL